MWSWSPELDFLKQNFVRISQHPTRATGPARAFLIDTIPRREWNWAVLQSSPSIDISSQLHRLQAGS